MILVSIIFFGGIGYLKGAQEAPDLPLAVAPPGSGCARWEVQKVVKTTIISIFIPNDPCTIVCFVGHPIVCSISYVKFVLQRVAIDCSTGGNSLFYR